MYVVADGGRIIKGQTLNITRAKIEDAGMYTCTIYTKVGLMTTEEQNLNILRKCINYFVAAVEDPLYYLSLHNP